MYALQYNIVHPKRCIRIYLEMIISSSKAWLYIDLRNITVVIILNRVFSTLLYLAHIVNRATVARNSEEICTLLVIRILAALAAQQCRYAFVD